MTNTRTRILSFDSFTLRDGERMQLSSERPGKGRYLAVMVRSVSMPAGEKANVRPIDGAAVEQAAILACEMNSNGQWLWCHLSPPTKEVIGDFLFDDCKIDRDKWYYLTLTTEPKETQCSAS